jgi:hypothetical protein
MRSISLSVTAVLLLSGGAALAQSGQAPSPVFPMPPPEPTTLTTPGGRDPSPVIKTDRHTRCLQ